MNGKMPIVYLIVIRHKEKNLPGQKGYNEGAMAIFSVPMIEKDWEQYFLVCQCRAVGLVRAA